MARSTVIKSGPIAYDTSDFRAFAKDCRRADPVLSKSMRSKLKGAGELVADDARERASYSKKIVPTIRTSVAGASVAVLAGRTGVPLAGLEELGNQGTDGSSPVFRHPVYGNRRNWVSQRRRPFLAPALEAKRDEAAERVFEALDDAVDVAVGRA